jgi:hypothetical protein
LQGFFVFKYHQGWEVYPDFSGNPAGCTKTKPCKTQICKAFLFLSTTKGEKFIPMHRETRQGARKRSLVNSNLQGFFILSVTMGEKFIPIHRETRQGTQLILRLHYVFGVFCFRDFWKTLIIKSFDVVPTKMRWCLLG